MIDLWLQTIIVQILTLMLDVKKEEILYQMFMEVDEFCKAYQNYSQTHGKCQFWQSDNHPIGLYTLPVIAQKIGYIHLNPVKEGWVAEAEQYI